MTLKLQPFLHNGMEKNISRSKGFQRISIMENLKMKVLKIYKQLIESNPGLKIIFHRMFITGLFLILVISVLPSVNLGSLTSLGDPAQLSPLSTQMSRPTSSESIIHPETKTHDLDSLPQVNRLGCFSQQTLIPDPTGRTVGYTIENTSERLELTASRGMTNRHWYHPQTNQYQYTSDTLVNQPGIIEDSDWVTEEEYPHRFIIRLRNSSIYFFESPDSIPVFLSQIENSTLWGVGYESFNGVMAFYLNFQDTEWGHAQYLYYPRLTNTSLPSYDSPLYALFPHLYVQDEGNIYDKILNDRTLYSEPFQNPRNTLHFYQDVDTWGLYFDTPNVSILSSTWNFRHGFKYNKTDGLFHMINQITCLTHSFSDVGFAYELMSAPQTDGTGFKPARFLFSNISHQIEKTIDEVWNAGAILNNHISQVEIFSQNNKAHIGTNFNDMEEAGFTQKYLNLHNQLLPNGISRKTLRFGMYGYGSFLAGSTIEIDPTTTWYVDDDNNDLWREYSGTSSWKTGNSYMEVGREWVYDYPVWDYVDMDGYFAIDTGITAHIETITNASLELYFTTNYFESGDGISCRIYNIGGNFNTFSAKENDTSGVAMGTQVTQTGIITGSGTGWKTASSTKIQNALNYWAQYRESEENYISWRLEKYNCDYRQADYARIGENTSSYDPKLTFTYNVTNPPPTGCHDPTGYSGGSGWTNVTNAYTLNNTYALGTSNTSSLYFTDYDWSITPKAIIIQKVKVLVNWRAENGTSDYLKVRVHYLGGPSNWTELTSHSLWALDTLDFSNATTWTPSKINDDAFFKVEIQKVAPSTSNYIYVDWVGTFIEYGKVEVDDWSFSNGTKGDINHSLQVKFKNSGTVVVSDFNFKIQLDHTGDIYYEPWVDVSFSGSTIAVGGTSWVYATISRVFEGASNAEGSTGIGWYALNSGEYEITHIFANHTSWGSKNNTLSNAIFSITSGATHKVFVTAIVCDDISTSHPTTIFDDIETNSNFRIYGENASTWANTSFQEHFSTDFLVTVFNSDANTSAIGEGGEHSWARTQANNLLGLSNSWSNGIGTQPGNHGFDLLITFVEPNISATTVSAAENCIFITNYNTSEGYLFNADSRAILHEVLHTYMHNEDMEAPHGCIEHLEYTPMYFNYTDFNETSQEYYWYWKENTSYNISGICGFIMGLPASWHIHPDTDERVANWIDEYDDGP